MSSPVTMRAAVYRRRGVLEVDRIPVPEPGPEEVLVAVEHCGVCGTDLHSVLDGWGIPNTVGGHEYTGTVVAVGASVTDWKPGDPAVGGPGAPCGACRFCHDGRTSLCENRTPMGETEFQGAFAEFVSTPAVELLHLPDGVPLRHAALAEPLAVALHALDRVPTASAGRVLVSGAGPIGALIVAALATRGVVEIHVSEPSSARRELAAHLGATVCEPDDLVTPASPSEVVSVPFDVAFETSGKAPAVEACLGQLGITGTLVIVGAGLDQPRLDPNRILLNELVITGSCASGPGDFESALELMASGSLPIDDLIETDDVPLDRMLDAMKELQAGSIPGKVLITP